MFAGCNVAIVGAVAPTDPSGGPANGQITVSTAGVPAALQHESTMERASDVLVFDDATVAGGNCFAAGNHILLTYGATLTYPLPLQTSSANFDVYDSASSTGLSILTKSSSSIAANAPAWLVEIDVQSPGTAATAAGGITQNPTGSAVRVRNLRFDVTPLSAGSSLTVTVSATVGLPQPFSGTVGTVMDTVASGSGITQIGAGTQSAGSTLVTPAILDLAENYVGAFRPASTNASGVYGDVATTATRVVFDFGATLPTGVTATFPTLIQVGGSGGLTLTLRTAASCAGPAQCTAVYDTTANGSGVYDVRITTAASPNTGENGQMPALGVSIANPSGYGTATLAGSVVPSHLTSISDFQVRLFSGALFAVPAGVIPVTTITSISPNTVVAGSAALPLVVTGGNFSSTAVVQWNGTALATFFSNNTELIAVVPVGDLAAAGTASVNVLSGGKLTNSVSFVVTAASNSGSPLQYDLPHVTSGNGYATKITIINTSSAQNNVSVHFLSQAGVTLSTTDYSLAPGATLRIGMTDAERFGSPVTKWATVGSQSPVVINTWYDYEAMAGANVGNSVSFEDASPMTDFSFPVEFSPAISGITTGKVIGIAIANPNASGVIATLKLVDSTGTVLASRTVNLTAWGQTAIDLSQAAMFGSVLPSSDFVGSITVSATLPVSSIGVQGTDGLFSAIPVGGGRAK